MSKPTYPDIIDPVIIVADDGMLFIAWVEPFADRTPRWVFVSRDRDRYVGPPYAGEHSLEQFKALINDWWRDKKALGQQGVTPTRLRGWLTDGR